MICGMSRCRFFGEEPLTWINMHRWQRKLYISLVHPFSSTLLQIVRGYLPIHIGYGMFELALLYNYWPQRLIKADLFIQNYILFHDSDDL